MKHKPKHAKGRLSCLNFAWHTETSCAMYGIREAVIGPQSLVEGVSFRKLQFHILTL